MILFILLLGAVTNFWIKAREFCNCLSLWIQGFKDFIDRYRLESNPMPLREKNLHM